MLLVLPPLLLLIPFLDASYVVGGASGACDVLDRGCAVVVREVSD